MTTATEMKTLSKKTALLRFAVVFLVAMAVAAVGVVVLYIDAPAQGEACSVESAITQDAVGHTLTCMSNTGKHELVWQNTPQADLELQGDRQTSSERR